MSLMDLTCKDSISYSKRCNKDIDGDILYLGNYYRCNYLICLYFALPRYSVLQKLKKASLVLYKLPEDHNDCRRYKRYNKHEQCKKYKDKYIVCPLEDYFSAYSRDFSIPDPDFDRKKEFRDTIHSCFTEIDITDIVKDWINEEIENRGLILLGRKDSHLIIYASKKCSISRMCPTLRLIYEEKGLGHRYITIPCEVDVKSY